MANRLQFVHHSECFATAEEAKKYVLNLQTIEHPSLFSEPMVLCYGDATNPNIILAIGSVGDGTASINNRTFFIDNASIEEDIQKIYDELKDHQEAIEALQDLTAQMCESCGLDTEGKYTAPEDVILKTATTLKNADELLSKYIQEHTISVQDTNSVDLTLSDSSETGQTLSADVKLASYKTVDKVELPNIIIKEDNGLFTNVDLDYEDNVLTFTVNGVSKEFDLPEETYLVKGEYDVTTENIVLTLNTGAEVRVDVEKLIGEWTVLGEYSTTPIVLTKDPCTYEEQIHGVDKYQDVLHADIRLLSDAKYNNILKKSDDGKSLYVDGIASNITYNKKGTIVTVQEALDEGKCAVSLDSTNIISTKLDGIYANVNLAYDASTNVLKFYRSNPEGTVDTATWTLNTTKILDDVSYDSTTESLVLRFITSDGKYQTVTIPVHDIITEWKCDNTSTDVTLTRTRTVAGTDTLSAKLNISTTRTNNILQTDNHVVWVDGVASKIRYNETYSVEGKLDALDTKIDTDVETEKTRAEAQEEILNDAITANTKALGEEITRAKEAEERLGNDVGVVSGGVVTVSGIATGNTVLINKEETRAEDAEKALSGNINSVSAIVSNHIVSAGTELSNVHADINAVSGGVVTVSGIATGNTVLINKEETRAEDAEKALSDAITANTKALNDHAVSAGTEIHNIYDAIGVVSGSVVTVSGVVKTNTAAIEAEETRAKTAENALSGNINSVSAIVSNHIVSAGTELSNVHTAITFVSGGVVTVSGIATANTSAIKAEETRAEDAEKALSDAITANTKALNDHAVSAGTEIHNIYDAIGVVSGSVVTVSGVVKTNTAAIEAEETRAKTAENALSGNINSVSAIVSNHIVSAGTELSNVHTAITFVSGGVVTVSGIATANTSAIKAEETRAKAAEDALSGNMNSVSAIVSNHIVSAGTELHKVYDAIGAVSGGVDTVSGAVKTNTAAITANTKALNDHIVSAGTELSNVHTAITFVSGSVVTVSGIATANTSAIKAEETRAKAAEDALSGNINSVSAIVSNHISSAGTELSNVHADINAVSGGVVTVSGAVNTNTSAIATEKARAEEAEKALSGNINSVSAIVNNHIVSGGIELHKVYDTIKDVSGIVETDIDKIDVIYTEGDNTLKVTTKTGTTTYTLAKAKVSTQANNLLKYVDDALYASNQASEIKLADGTDVNTTVTKLQSVSGNANVSSIADNIISFKSDGLYAHDAVLTYDTGSNTLYYQPASATTATPITLNSIDTIKEIYFDGVTDELVFKYTVEGEDKEVRIKAAAFFKGIAGTSDGNVTVTTALTTTTTSSNTVTGISANLDVDKIIATENSTVTLSKTSANKISASVNIATSVPHNILQEDGSHSSLFVIGEASNIYATYNDEDTNVQSALNNIHKDIVKISGDLATEIENRIKADEVLSAAIDSNTEEINKLKVRLTTLEEKVESGFTAIWAELERLDKKATIVDGSDNDYLIHTITYPDANGNTAIKVDINTDLSKDPDTGLPQEL